MAVQAARLLVVHPVDHRPDRLRQKLFVAQGVDDHRRVSRVEHDPDVLITPVQVLRLVVTHPIIALIHGPFNCPDRPLVTVSAGLAVEHPARDDRAELVLAERTLMVTTRGINHVLKGK